MARAWQSFRSGGFEVPGRAEPHRWPGRVLLAPDLWLNEMFATAKRPGRVLAGLIARHFDLPLGISSVNLPIIGTGTRPQHRWPTPAGVPDPRTSPTAPGPSTVVTIAGQADVAHQSLEQSPARRAPRSGRSSRTWPRTTTATSRPSCISGHGVPPSTSSSASSTPTTRSPTRVRLPTGHAAMWPFFRPGRRPGSATPVYFLPKAWLMRTARWSWLHDPRGHRNRRPFGLSVRRSSSAPTRRPRIRPADSSPCARLPRRRHPGDSRRRRPTRTRSSVLRPTDLILFEGQPQHLGDDRGALWQPSAPASRCTTGSAAITNRLRRRRLSSFGGTGLVVQANFLIHLYRS